MKKKATIYSKSKTDRAGEILRLNNSSGSEKDSALTVLSTWRAAHSYPMHVFTTRLRKVSTKIDSKSITAQRLKRVPSIIKKLNRTYLGKRPTMKLTQMQDIAGCRTVLSNMRLVKKLHKDYYQHTTGSLKHIKVNEKNYIENPKKDGYRSIHLVYRYQSDKKKKEYNGLLIEIQIRSELQHIWATAVETVDFFTGQAIKSNEGEKEWKEFFKLISSAFAMTEKTPLVPKTPTNKEILYKQIIKMEKELNVISKMKEWTNSIRFFDDLKDRTNAHFFLLELDTVQEKLTVSSFSKRLEQKALFAYAETEKKIYGKKQYDVVLVAADTIDELKLAYPNYFIDTRTFIKKLNNILNTEF